MASESVHQQEIRIRDLPTRSVTLFPSRAQIIRDINNVALKPGPNQIIIEGLSPTVDEHSIKVEGTGSATITDVTTDRLPNREAFEDIYPSESEDEDSDGEDEAAPPNKEVAALDERLKDLNMERARQMEQINSAAQRLKICDAFGQSVETARPAPSDLPKLLQAYQDERTKMYADHEAATLRAAEIAGKIEKINKEKLALAKAIVKAKEKEQKEKQKQKQKELRQKAEKLEEKERIKAERESFWPKEVYRITINLEPTSFTPAVSRRSSLDGDTIASLATSDFHEPSATPLKTDEISLSLSYITHSASWSPRYNLSLDSVKNTGMLEYGAELTNTTSETWRDARVVLSTSQTSFSGLGETIPQLLPWHVRLQKSTGRLGDEMSLFSIGELQAKRTEWDNNKGQSNVNPRWKDFGRDNTSHNAHVQQLQQAAKQKATRHANQAVQFMQSSAPHPVSLFGQAQTQGHATGGLYGAGTDSLVRAQSYAMAPMSGPICLQRKSTEDDGEDTESGCSDEVEVKRFDTYASKSLKAAAPPSLAFEEGDWDENGLTASYDLPANKTLAPSNSTIKHKIAKVEFKNVTFSHIVIGKLRQVGFLKARLRNTSKITLLKGPLGLTLDGSFLGQASFPRCSVGESFSLALGVDPAITVVYPKPTVRRSQTGIFNKEDTNVFLRSMTITNTKHNAAIDLTVLDQVPVSEDERLRIEITNPKGLKPGMDGVRAGQSAAGTQVSTLSKGTAKEVRASVSGIETPKDTKWGSAVASAKKGGEIAWNVKLNPGMGVKLSLEYEASFPAGECVVSGK